MTAAYRSCYASRVNDDQIPEIHPPERAPLSEELSHQRARFQRAREDAARVLEGLTDEQLAQRPAPQRWSVGECLDHLIVMGRLVCDRIDEAIERAHREGLYSRGPFRYGRTGNWLVRAWSDPGRKTPAVYAPRLRRSCEAVLHEFDALQVNLIERVEAADGIDLVRVKIPSPASRFGRLSLGQWFELLAGHQERQLQQAADVGREILG